MSRCDHEFNYGGVVNIFDGENLLRVYEYWKCRKCGVVKAGYRTSGSLSPTNGLLPEPQDNGKWMIFLCRPVKNTELYYVKPGEKIVHRCVNKEIKFYVDDEYKVRIEGAEEIEGHHYFLLEDVSPGVIDISKDPVRVIKSS